MTHTERARVIVKINGCEGVDGLADDIAASLESVERETLESWRDNVRQIKGWELDNVPAWDRACEAMLSAAEARISALPKR